ncbi:hypothetical protein N7G274_010204 [Stereocaulon virgatum]|uniref:Zn(2)-C6 fungal-type domain-containing protein n=1 Tax=Stereocaulon virgatum TaxID=373712 RepID=A0ABR3ZU38_9LECA
MLRPVGRFRASRAGGPHVRTGCVTCKKRHVKCDEAKPSCLKCSSTGRVCDGYLAKKTASPSKSREAQILPAYAVAVARGPDVGIQGTDTERQGFEFFYTSISWKVAKLMNLKTSHQFILQASHVDKAVLSAIVAVGYIGRKCRNDANMIPGSANNKPVDDFAHRQYCKTLNHLQGLISEKPNRPIEFTVITCFLLVLFEFFRGDYQAAMVHIRSGINILHPSVRPLQSVSSLKQELFRAFSIGSIAAPYTRQLSQSSRYLRGFSTLEEAAISLSFLVARVHHYRQFSRLYQRITALELTPLSLAIPGEDVHPNLDAVKCAVTLDVFLESVSTAVDEGESTRIAIMRINRITQYVILSTTLQPITEKYYVSCEPYFREIVSLAASVIRQTNGEIVPVGDIVAASNLQGSRVSGDTMFHEGLIYPLFFTAVKCENAGIRGQAISLLINSPWQEGPWNSARVAASLHETGGRIDLGERVW